MKGQKMLVWMLLLGIVMTGCINDKRKSGPQNPEGTVVGTVSPPLTQPNSRETQLLSRNYWVAEFYVIPGDQGQLIPARHNKGLWWQFNMDGTFVGGQWQEQNDHGSWFWRPGGGQYDRNGMLYIDSAVDDQRDVEFQIQGIEDDGSVMSFVKTQNSANKEPGMLKMITLMTMPTKKQFGVEE